MPGSIQRRLISITSLILVVFLTSTGWVLDRTYSASIVQGAGEQLKLVVYALMGAAEEEGASLVFNQSLADPRLAQAESGLYAIVTTDQKQILWRSPSLQSIDSSNFSDSLSFTNVAPGVFTFSNIDSAPAKFQLSYAVIWEGIEPNQVVFTAIVDQAPYLAAIDDFRQNLWLGLGGATLFFILAQLLALNWGLQPLLVMQKEVRELEHGTRSELSNEYPLELSGLAENLQRFASHEQQQRVRYRQALDNLAHSLKTPLSVLRNALVEVVIDKSLIKDQIDRMQDTVSRQLARVVVAAPVMLSTQIDVAEVTRKLVRTLEVAFPKMDLLLELHTQPKLRIDEGDLLEILGNVIENACKYGKYSVRICVDEGAVAHAADSGIRITVEDDGPGIPNTMREEVLGRGLRLDTQVSGQGIGLAVAKELVALYEGGLSISDSEMGGAKIALNFPLKGL
jgi:two-component system sensor histidine kinase PhoQ|tara:strand:+ start:6324 stop:7682 length:1359 start_codon:yes stop_codon:yes gene_type:complete